MRLYEFVDRAIDADQTLYVNRSLMNPEDILEWAKDQGFAETLSADDFHVTIAFSKAKVDWSVAKPLTNTLTVTAGNRSMEAFGKEKNIAVLRFSSEHLQDRWQYFADMGCSWDHDDYCPHVTICYTLGGVALEDVEPYRGPLVFGPESFAPVDENWKEKAKDASTTT